MNILDENISESQRDLLNRWHISNRQIGNEIGRKGMSDVEIISLLLQQPRATFFTRDLDFYRRHLCHAHYCIVYLSVERFEVAKYIRRFMQHSQFNTMAKRAGFVVRVAPAGFVVWVLNAQQESFIPWDT